MSCRAYELQAGSARQDGTVQVLPLLHESVLLNMVQALNLTGKLAFQCTSQEFHTLAHRCSDYWAKIDLRNDEICSAKLLIHCLEVAQGAVKQLYFREGERCPEAAVHESVSRFQHGLRYCDPIPFTLGHWAGSLASLIPNLQELCIDESTSCLGGMTDDFAKAIAARCPALKRLEVRFSKNPLERLAAERFTDDGLSALAEHCNDLRVLVLRHCLAITDRSLYALAANCTGLTELRLSGYSEAVSDAGLALLLSAAAPSLVVCHLSSKLTRVTDASVLALLQQPADTTRYNAVLPCATQGERGITVQGHGAAQLRSLKLGRNATDTAIDALSYAHTVPPSVGSSGARPPGLGLAPCLQHLHIAKCRQVTALALIDLVTSGACPQLSQVRVSKALGDELAACQSSLDGALVVEARQRKAGERIAIVRQMQR